MESVAVDAARWVVGKALSPLSEGFVEAWAASSGLGPNIGAVKMELLYAQGMLDNARGRETRSPALKQLLRELRGLAYDADDVLDELDYFRIQDELDGTYEAAAEHAKGCLYDHVLNTRHTARDVASKLGLLSCSHAATTADVDPDETPEEGANKGCLSTIACSCGGGGGKASRQIISSPPPTHDADDEVVVGGNGCMQKLASSARCTVHLVGKRLLCLSVAPEQDEDNPSAMHTSKKGSRFLCCGCHSKAAPREHAMETPKLKFDRVEMSRRMKHIVEQLKPVCAKVSTILNLELLESNRNIGQCIAMSLNAEFSRKPGHAPVLPSSIAMHRPVSISQFTDPQFYGREVESRKIFNDITTGDCCYKDLTVIPIVGTGGIGKTTLTQVMYEEVKSHFDVKVWVCVSLGFNVYRLKEEIVKLTLKVNDEKDGGPDDLIEQRLKSKKFLLVLDDMWNCGNDDEWNKLLAPLKKGQTKGNIILVTTRFPAVAEMVKTIDRPIELEGLDPEMFWELFQACVFDEDQSRKDHTGLLETGKKIANKLKGSPLAAKTVGRLLRNHLDLDHWTRVLESKEWELQTGDNDIMPALKLSYDYLPFHLQQCFTYCGLFPEDYWFDGEEMIHLWIGLDILHSEDQIKRIEEIGSIYLNDLVNYGFFKKSKKEDGSFYYVIHDLLHDLALKVSSYECLTITSSNVRSIQIPPSIRHLSIVIDDMDVNDRPTFENCKEDFSTLIKRLNSEKLHSLMLFGQYHGSFVIPFGDLFREAKALRVILLSGASYAVENLLHNFSKLVHLRYLRIREGYFPEISLPSTISRFYHLRILDVQQCRGYFSFPRDMNNLVRMRHFLVPDDSFHSDIVDVGKLKCLQELRRFEVKKQVKAFELGQLGQLAELKGSLGIYKLEKVKTSEEAHEAKLIHKSHLHKLTLDWAVKDPALQEHVLESLKPHSNLRELHIRGHGGATCPTWLGVNMSIKGVESLHLNGVDWKNFPPIGEVCLVNEHGVESLGCSAGQGFQNLKRLELVSISRLKKWTRNDTCHVFSLLEILIIRDCPELMELPFSHSICPQPEQGINMTTQFPCLRKLEIAKCPKLSSLPPIPWTSDPCTASIQGVGLDFESLAYSKDYQSVLHLVINGKDGLSLDSAFWNVLAFSNLTELKELEMNKCPPLPLEHLQMLSSLRELTIWKSLSMVDDESTVRYQFPAEKLHIDECGASGKELTQLLYHFPKLSMLRIWDCQKITGLGVVEQQMAATPASSPSASANKLEEDTQIEQEQQQPRGEDGIAAAAAGLLLLPPQLQELTIYECSELILDADTAGCEGGGRGLQGLRSLRSLRIVYCPNLLSSCSSSSTRYPFPSSLQELDLIGVRGMETLAPLSNLSSLTRLHIANCGDLRGEGMSSLLSQDHLIDLTVRDTPKFFVGGLDPSRLQKLSTDDIAGFLAVPICSSLSSSLTELAIDSIDEVERFTKEQNEALQLLSSLQDLQFRYCSKLQSLPSGLHRLTSLKRLQICYCRAVRSLPKGGLPSSLQVLDVSFNSSEELKRQCRKLRGIIPIIKTLD